MVLMLVAPKASLMAVMKAGLKDAKLVEQMVAWLVVMLAVRKEMMLVVHLEHLKERLWVHCLDT